MAVKTLDDLFLLSLKDIYYAEQQVLKALPKMMKEAETPDLKQAFEHHRKETEQQVERLKKVFQIVGEKPSGEECPAIEGIIEEAEEHMKEIDEPSVCDAALISAAQAVEHYEIARYGTLMAWAKELGHKDAIELLSETLEEEKRTDELLTSLAERKINQAAA